jgi:hypothetical protein
MERLSAYARRACARAREWALPDMARWSAYEASILVLAAAAYGLGAALAPTLIATGLASAALALTFVGAFVVAFVQIARHPERDNHWRADTRAGGPQNPLNLGLWRIGGPDYTYGNRCKVKHPSGTVAVVTDENEYHVPDKHRKVFEFIYGGLSSNFPSDAPEPVTGRYEVTWELRLKADGPWRPVVHDRDVAITLPKVAQT